jgi:hypothetical protein
MKTTPLILSALALALVSTGLADEGMWLFSAPPRAKIEATYGFKLDDAWLDHVQKASVHFAGHGSGAFVSGDGLLITNEHLGLDALQKMSNDEKNFVRDGFYAATSADEVKCDDELNVLISTEDVTARVNAGVPAHASGNEAADARRKIISDIENEAHAKTGLLCDVTMLYQGGAYFLYEYKRYTDVRLVFAPEQKVAFFGGDPDNFEYPRYDLDICIFRVYENGRPVHPQHFIKWSANGAKDGDLVFVSGYPGHTDRLLTMAELDFMRDFYLPASLAMYKRAEAVLTAWSARSDENAGRAQHMLFGIRNARKLFDGMLAGMLDPSLMDGKERAETKLKSQIADLPDGQVALDAYKRIASAQLTFRRVFSRIRMLGAGFGFASDSFTIARQLLQAGDEREKPNGQRLPEYSEQSKESLETQLFSEKPIYEDLEILTLSDSLTYLVETLGYQDLLVQTVLGGKSPRDRAAELILSTRVRDVAFRRRLYEGGAAAVRAANDPMIEVARAIDAEARYLRETFDETYEVVHQAHSVIERARFSVEGSANYPDATSSLRLAYGTVRGYTENGESVSPVTTISGLYKRSDEHQNHEPFELPVRWERAKTSIKMDTPLNFVSTCDTIVGNSGSPILNKEGEFVGIFFDGNIESLATNIAFDPVRSRAIGVDSRAILEALRDVYHAAPLADELISGHR